jgi:hypothetical protein
MLNSTSSRLHIKGAGARAHRFIGEAYENSKAGAFFATLKS